MKNVMLILCAVATSAAPVFPVSSYSVAELPTSISHQSSTIIHNRAAVVYPVVHQTVIPSPKLEYAPLEGAPIEEHVIDTLPPPSYMYPKHSIHPKIHHDMGSVFDSTRPHIEYAPGIQNTIASSRSPASYVRHAEHLI